MIGDNKKEENCSLKTIECYFKIILYYTRVNGITDDRTRQKIRALLKL